MNSPIPKEGLIGEVDGQKVQQRAAQTAKMGKYVVKTPVAAARGGVRAARQPVSRIRQSQSLQKAEARLQQRHGLSNGQPSVSRTNQRQQAREAKMMAKNAAHNQKSNVQSKGRGMGRG